MLALAAQVHIASRGRDYRGVFVFLVVPAAYIAVLGGCKALRLEQFATSLSPAISANNIAIVAFVIYLAAVACLYARRPGFAGFAAFALLLVAADVIHVVRAPDFVTIPGVPTSRIDAYGYPEPCELREDLYLTTVRANRYLTGVNLYPPSIAVWWDEDERLGLNRTDACRLPTRFVAIPVAATGFALASNPAAPTISDVVDPRRIAVLAGDRAHRQWIIERINSVSRPAAYMTWQPIGEKQIETPVLRSSITLLKPRYEFPDQAGATNLGNLFESFDATKPAQIKIAPQPWAYGVDYPSTRPDLKGPLWIQITARLTGGPFGVALLTPDKKSFAVRRRIEADPGIQHVTLAVPKDVALGDLVVAAWDIGNAGDAEIQKIEVVVPPAAASR